MNQLLSDIIGRLSPHLEDREARAVARCLCEQLLGLDPVRLYLDKNTQLSTQQQQKLSQALERLLKDEPLQYILGTQSFMGRTFRVGKGVLIPRPETADLVEKVLRLPLEEACVLDVGTGSGCIALTLALERPRWQVTALDNSPAALETARENALLLGADVRFIRLDILREDLPFNTYDAIVSNPPYVPESDRRDMQASVRDHEPGEALFVADEDPLLFYRVIAQKGLSALKAGGGLLFEIHHLMGKKVCLLLEEMGYERVCVTKDIEGKDRYVTAQKSMLR